ncbi:hypothetical protein [Collimonas humicola]|uniref:hypothetical protein n=1 Tax=Collimonas humicola TaxID=2825886 RepID=UPI001B8B07E7|nr:hypothetical protein [Collimonas humicola]
MEAEHIISMYFIRYLDPISKKWGKTRWPMTEEDAVRRYERPEYEVMRLSKMDRVVRFGPYHIGSGTSRFHIGTPGGGNLKNWFGHTWSEQG